jgi:SpoVK/Ycf46/Vps4 family AAA+-type ATPase
VYHFERTDKVYIIGGGEETFKPTVTWDEVILPEALKADLRSDMEIFFTDGVKLYRQLNLPAFRKLLLVGPPGTGKSSLCAALAKVALDQKYVVVYVSATLKNNHDEGAAFDKVHTALRYAKHSTCPVLLIIEEIDIYLKAEDKAQILNVLDGFESPNNKHGVLLIATTNYPEVIDERIAKRPGRIDRIVYVPEIQDTEQAVRMLRRYMGEHYHDDHAALAEQLIGKTGAFVREASLFARMMTLQRTRSDAPAMVTVDTLLQSITRLENQLATEKDLVTPAEVVE